MATVWRTLSFLLIVLLANLAVLLERLGLGPLPGALIGVSLGVFFLLYNILPVRAKGLPTRLAILLGGRELLLMAAVLMPVQAAAFVYLLGFDRLSSVPTLILNAVATLVVVLILVWNGMLRLLCTSGQLKLWQRLALIFGWWIPVVNLFLIGSCCRAARREFRFESMKRERNLCRSENDVCRTRYPILLVHGIFWRDWQVFHYWGRIPRELTRNGATLYYGNQHSAAPMEVCADELKDQILHIVEKENCGKVNIVAHSKGGLDARYAISRLGLENCVASLTTVCTPHQGCQFVDRILTRLPDRAVRSVARRYNGAYKKLGDTQPDFYTGVYDLTTDKCAEFNEQVPDKENVVYQSVASKMNGFFSAGFPLNIGYAFICRTEGDNDGFVTVESSRWGEFLGCCGTRKKRGVSHGDMIDLMRENIRDFDVCETYVDIVKGLKARGL